MRQRYFLVTTYLFGKKVPCNRNRDTVTHIGDPSVGKDRRQTHLGQSLSKGQTIVGWIKVLFHSLPKGQLGIR